MIIKLRNTPTAADYIQAFRENNDSLVNQFIRESRDKFIPIIKKKFEIKFQDELEDIFSEALTRLMENIYRKKISEDDFSDSQSDSLYCYLRKIGIYVALEERRKSNRMVSYDVEEAEIDSTDLGSSDDGTLDDEETAKSFNKSMLPSQQIWHETTWLNMVENPYNAFIQKGHSLEECSEEWDRLASEYEKEIGLRDIKKVFYTEVKHDERTMREVIIKELVDNMGDPCEPLLKGFYFEQKSMAKLAGELKYSNADSAKTQKNKCMGKLKAIVNQQIKRFLA